MNLSLNSLSLNLPLSKYEFLFSINDVSKLIETEM